MHVYTRAYTHAQKHAHTHARARANTHTHARAHVFMTQATRPSATRQAEC